MEIKRFYMNKKVDCLFYWGLCLSLGIVFFRFIRGEQFFIYEDIGSDTYNQYYPYFVHEVLAIKNGTFSSWIWNYGIGTAIQNVNAWTFDPFGILLVLLGVILGADKVAYLLVWMQILKIVVVFALAKKYISFFSSNRVAINLGAYAIAMNGYLFLWGQHYSMGTACVYQLALIIAIEMYIRSKCKKGGCWIAWVVAFMLVYSYYTGYMILLFSAAYFVYRYLYENELDIRKLIVDWVKCIGWVASGGLVSSVVFIPASYYVLTNSSRMGAASSGILHRMKEAFFSSFSLDEFLKRFTRVLSNNSLFIYDSSKSMFGNYYEDPQLFCSVFIIVFLCIWLFTNCWGVDCVKKRVLHILLAVACFILAFNSLSGLVLNGFVTVAHRHTFLLFPLFGVVIAQGFDSLLEHRTRALLAVMLGSFGSFLIWYYAWVNCSEQVQNYVIILGVEVLVGCLLLFWVGVQSRMNKMLVALFVIVALLSTIAEDYVTTNERDCVTREESEQRVQWADGRVTTDSALALAWLHSYDHTYFRVEKTYGDWGKLSDSFIEQYSGVTCYNSTPNKHVETYYDYIYPNNENMYHLKWFMVDNELQRRAVDIAAVKYVLSKENVFLNWKMIQQVGQTYIFQNPNVSGIASWYTKVVSQDQYFSWNVDEVADFLKEGVILDELVPIQPEASAEVGNFTVKGNTLRGTAICDGEGVLLLSIPNQEGWTVTVDGKKKHTVNADFGFIGVHLNTGSHLIEAKYSAPKFRLGVCASLIGLLLLAFFSTIERRTLRK